MDQEARERLEAAKAEQRRRYLEKSKKWLEMTEKHPAAPEQEPAGPWAWEKTLHEREEPPDEPEP